jgi:hypothetical protein
MSSREFAQWLAYMRHEPVGEDRLDVLFAHLSALLANINRDEKQRAEAYTMKDFLIDWWQESQESQAAPSGGRSPEEMYMLVRTWALLAGAKKAQ